MRDEKEGRKKQARSNKQQGKATQHTQDSHCPKKNENTTHRSESHGEIVQCSLAIAGCDVVLCVNVIIGTQHSSTLLIAPHIESDDVVVSPLHYVSVTLFSHWCAIIVIMQ